MINPHYKINSEKPPSGLNFAEIAQIECLVKGTRLENRIFDAKIMGKIKNANAYVISVLGLNLFYPADAFDRRHNYIKSLKEKYGYPIRQIELEWGSFSGKINEFVVSEHELTKRNG
jgi:hypothetical protein